MKINIFQLLITRPMGFIIKTIYDFVGNYGIAIILFTVLIKLLMLPLQMKSQKSMKKTQKLQPMMNELRKKYANDQQKLQQEMSKLYKENGASMTGGCLPLLIQFPILWGLYRVIRQPITFILGIDLTQYSDKIIQIVNEIAKTDAASQVKSLLEMEPAKMVESVISNYQIQLSTWANSIAEPVKEWFINFKFLGMDLSSVPSEAIKPLMSGDFSDLSTILLLSIPILAMLTSWLSMKQSQKMSGQNMVQGEDTTASMTKGMNLIMPIMIGFMAFPLPSGMGIYWITSNLIQMIQQFALNIYFSKKEEDFVVKIPEKYTKKGKKRK